MNRFLRRMIVPILGLLACAAQIGAGSAQAADPPRLQLEKSQHVVLIGNTLAERMQYFGNFETLLHTRFPDLELVVRDLGWSADELMLRPRSKDFQNHGNNLSDHKADVVLAFFGFNESFGGPAGLAKFKDDLEKFIKETLSAKYNGHSAPQLVLFSPIAHEDLHSRYLIDGQENNKNIALYTASMAKAAAKHGLVFVDLYAPSRELMQQAQEPLTINGVHLNPHGDRLLATVIDEALFGARPGHQPDFKKLRAAVNEKNQQFFYDYRAVNGAYIYGGRKAPFGIVNFPAEFTKLRAMIANRDRRIWAVAQGKEVPAQIDDSHTGELVKVETNFTKPITLYPPEESRQKFKLPEGYEVNLFASEVEFPELEKPVQFAFDARGRLWVCCMPSYPQCIPDVPVDDKILIFEDTDGDGQADKRTVFADKMYLPTGIEFGDGGVYVGAQPNMTFLKDTDGDDKADVRELILHGFDSADSHHAIHAFAWDQGGALYFNEGVFHYSQIETPYGPRRCANAGIYRFEPRTRKLDVFVSYNFANPWGHIFDRWGQNFVADASGGANYYGTAFSGDVDYPNKHGSLKQFLVKQWRPTAGCELVSSRNFPDDVQGNYLLNNCIGFQGVLQYKMREDGSGFAADPIEPLLQSSDPNVRPTDIEFGPDGALYICDWFNPLVGHMQHSIRDPNRDHSHGRIWRIRYTGRPLVKPAKIAGQSIAELLDLLKTEPEERTRYRVRSELRERDSNEVMSELDRWLAGLDQRDEEYEHHQLEALWLHQRHDLVDEVLLKRVLSSSDYRARAAATRVLCYWRDRVSDPLGLLRQQVNDQHPRVRLEAVRAASFIDSDGALAVAIESLAYPLDDYLSYALKETLNKLRNVAPSSAAPLVKLLTSGRLPTERQTAVVELVCERGNGHDLTLIFKQLLKPDAYNPPLRRRVIELLTDAARTRKVKPEGDLSAIEKLVAGDAAGKDRGLQLAVIRLASAWRVPAISDELQTLATTMRAGDPLQEAAVDGLVAIGDQRSRTTIEQLASTGSSTRTRFLAASGQTKLDLDAAARNAAAALVQANPRDNSEELIDAFLVRKGGSDKLAAALEGKPLPTDVAKRALRYMYSIGRSDPALSGVLSKAADIAADAPPPTPAEVKKLVAEVNSHGNAARGELIFRRGDLSCMKCHSISRAGGQVGPDLSAVGSISPVDYVLNSILNPNLAIKEAYVTRIVVTTSGETFTGIQVDRDSVRLVLRDAAGKQVTIPTADIEEEAEGKSLMPQGITKFLTHDELLDLAKFVSELGRPGPYEIPKVPAIQRWHVLKNVPAELKTTLSTGTTFERLVMGAGSGGWSTAYAKVDGSLPLDELRPSQQSDVLYVQGELDVIVSGLVTIDVQSDDPTELFLDRKPLGEKKQVTVNLGKGRHKITVRVAVGDKPGTELKVLVRKPAGSKAQFDIVGGM